MPIPRAIPGMTLVTETDHGLFDVHTSPPGAASFDQTGETLGTAEIAGVPVRFAGLDDLISMKRAAGRPVDLEDIAALTDPLRDPPAQPG